MAKACKRFEQILSGHYLSLNILSAFRLQSCCSCVGRSRSIHPLRQSSCCRRSLLGSTWPWLSKETSAFCCSSELPLQFCCACSPQLKFGPLHLLRRKTLNRSGAANSGYRVESSCFSQRTPSMQWLTQKRRWPAARTTQPVANLRSALTLYLFGSLSPHLA